MADSRYRLRPMFDTSAIDTGTWDIHVPIPNVDNMAVETEAEGTEEYAHEVAADLADKVHDDASLYLGERE